MESYYVQWETNEDAWNKDGPIILQIAQNQYEFTAYQLDEYSLTINTIDRTQKLDWYRSGDEMPLIWKKNPFEEINVVLDRKIEQIYLLEHSLTSGIVDDDEKLKFFQQITASDFFLVGIEFKINGFEKCLHLSNGLDCNEMKLYTTQVDHQNTRVLISE